MSNRTEKTYTLPRILRGKASMVSVLGLFGALLQGVDISVEVEELPHAIKALDCPFEEVLPELSKVET